MEQLKKDEGNPLADLQKKLEAAGIDTSKWGTDKSKTLGHLQKEIEAEETVLVTNDKGEILREVTVGGADLYYTSPEGKKYRLKEEKQIFKDGRERRRDLGSAVSEKMKAGENPKEAMTRGIQEELKITGEVPLIEIGVKDETGDSPSYPGLPMHMITYQFRGELNSEQYNPNGYIEEQLDKSTYFIWEEIKV